MNNGFILLARKLLDSKIWLKPPSYLKIWIYILFRVNYRDRQFPRGTNFFNYQTEKENLIGVSQDTWLNCIKWLKVEQKITTQKSARGLVIKVLKYEEYQDLKKYQKEIEYDTNYDTSTTQVRHKYDTIIERSKEVKNNKLVAKATVDLGKFPKADYSIITESYKKIKGVEPKGKEWLPILKEIKLMFQSGRTPTQIVKAMEVCNSLYDDWAMSTIRMKIADVVSGKLGVKTKQGESSLEIKSIKQR